MELTPELVWILAAGVFVCLVASGMFSAAETALFSLGRLRAALLEKRNVRGASRVRHLLDAPDRLLGTILIGNNVANIAASALTTSIAISLWGTAGVGYAIAILTVVVLVCCEFLPKYSASLHAEGASLWLARPIGGLSVVFHPLNVVLSGGTRALMGLIGMRSAHRRLSVSREELQHLADIAEASGTIQESEGEWVDNVLTFHARRISQCMIPMEDVVTIDKSASKDEIIRVVAESGYTRVPITDGSKDNVIGVLHVKDLLLLLQNPNLFIVSDLLREPHFTTPTEHAGNLFRYCRKNAVHLMVVRDEDRTVGMVTLEDLVEEIIGEIEDEFDVMRSEERGREEARKDGTESPR